MELIQPFMHGATCVVRTGGGFEPLEQYALRNQEKHRRKYRKEMTKDGRRYESVVDEMLFKHIRSKPKVVEIMQKMQWYFGKQGYLHYD